MSGSYPWAVLHPMSSSYLWESLSDKLMSLSIKRIKLISDKIVPFSHPHVFVLPTAILIMTSAVRLVVFQLTFVIVNFSLVNFSFSLAKNPSLSFVFVIFSFSFSLTARHFPFVNLKY